MSNIKKILIASAVMAISTSAMASTQDWSKAAAEKAKSEKNHCKSKNHCAGKTGKNHCKGKHKNKCSAKDKNKCSAAKKSK